MNQRSRFCIILQNLLPILWSVVTTILLILHYYTFYGSKYTDVPHVSCRIVLLTKVRIFRRDHNVISPVLSVRKPYVTLKDYCLKNEHVD